ncbi:hypothetical protein AAY473_004748, partial [Plecturocebus cupreus]
MSVDSRSQGSVLTNYRIRIPGFVTQAGVQWHEYGSVQVRPPRLKPSEGLLMLVLSAEGCGGSLGRPRTQALTGHNVNSSSSPFCPWSVQPTCH